MGKAKKGRKVEQENATKDVESDSEDDVQETKVKTKAKVKNNLDVEDATSIAGKKDKKKTKAEVNTKKKKAKESDSDSEVEIKATKGGFATLAISDDDDDDKPQSNDDEHDEVVKKNNDKKGDKVGKKNKRKKKDDDEDLDKILAELEMEYAGEAPPKQDEVAKEETDGKKKKKKDKDKKQDLVTEALQDIVLDVNEDEIKTVKSAAQKKKEKKEKQKKQAEKSQAKNEAPAAKEPSFERSESEEISEPKAEISEPKAEEVKEEGDEPDDGRNEDDKKKKKKKKGEKVKDEKEDKSKPKKKTILAMQAALQKLKEDEEKAAVLEAERIKKEDKAEQERLEQIRLEQEKKERKKQKEKEKKERLKAEGKLLNSKQKADRARAQAMIEAMNAMRVAPVGDSAPAPKHKPFTKLKKKTTPPPQAKDEPVKEEPKTVEVEIVEAPIIEVKEEPEVEDDVKDSWDIESDKEDEKSDDSTKKVEPQTPKVKKVTVTQKSKETETSESESESESDDDEESEEESDSDSDSDEKHNKKSDAAKKREKVIERIRKRHEVAESKRTTDELRAAVVCVLGHVDTGKTKILDKLRRTNVQDGEAGGITQQIGATNVPIDAIKEQAKIVKGFSQMELKIPGLLIIDTPGHESFSNLRSRGSSLCDIAILVVDIMHGLEPQTIESINLLKQRKTPFIVALNKIDRLYDWEMMARKDIRDVIKSQAANTQLEFEQRTNEVIVQFAEQGLNAALFYNNPDVRSYVSLIPTSATTGEGMGNLLALIVESCQTMLAKRLMFSEELHATVLEVKALPGLGTTIDVILVNGYLREGETMVLAGTEAPIVTQIRSLLMPQPMKELRVKNAYVEYKEVKAAQGVKIAAKDLEKVIAGLNLRVAEKPDEVEILKEEVAHELKHALSNIKLQERGVYVQASTLGSLEALLEFLKSSSIPYANIRIGPVVKKDVMKASTMLEHDSMYAVILAFDVKIDRDAQEMADSLGVKIFQADIIYHLFDKFIAFRDEIKAKKREEFKSVAVFPCKLKILPQFVFNSRDPIVVGVIVEAGIVREGTPLCVPSKDFVDIGIVTSIENNHKSVESARKGHEVCIKIEPIPGEAPKMFGRHFDEKDYLVSKISRQSIDACKDYFRDDLLKTDWQLMVELKKLFQIL